MTQSSYVQDEPTPKVRLLAFHLPQYHPIPENDLWWGPGFTDWIKVVRAHPLFPGHYQPHIPTELGFYDLRLPEARAAQAELARAAGIHGFCYYHYWFNGHRLLERPVNEILASGEPDFPFCLCWANENWTRRWDGQDQEVLIAQNYSVEDDVQHIEALLTAFRDPRYIKVNNKPLFLVYRLSRLPDPTVTLRRWRDTATRHGLTGLYICNVESFPTEHELALSYELDGAVEFAPDWTRLPGKILPPQMIRVANCLPFFRGRAQDDPLENNHVCRYADLAERMLAKPPVPYLRYPGVTPMWDNSARWKKHAVILRDASPELYESWLRRVIARFSPPSDQENFVFINAWNEWAEGNHLEPCQHWGRSYLEATERALSSSAHDSDQPAGTCSAVCHDRRLSNRQERCSEIAMFSGRS
jgi:O-antigen biosynthesis protein